MAKRKRSRRGRRRNPTRVQNGAAMLKNPAIQAALGGVGVVALNLVLEKVIPLDWADKKDLVKAGAAGLAGYLIQTKAPAWKHAGSAFVGAAGMSVGEFAGEKLGIADKTAGLAYSGAPMTAGMAQAQPFNYGSF